jgi:hypothetical protein
MDKGYVPSSEGSQQTSKERRRKDKKIIEPASAQGDNEIQLAGITEKDL